MKHGDSEPYVYIEEDECKNPPAMDPEYQWCEGGDVFTAEAPRCPGGKVRRC